MQSTTIAYNAKRLSLTLGLSFMTLLLLTEPSLAAWESKPGEVICFIINSLVYGNLGRGIATAGIATVGIGALFGRVTWNTAVLVAVGIAILFGAPALLVQVFPHMVGTTC